MRTPVIAVLVAATLAFAAPAFAQSSDNAPPPHGGLTVCCGGTVGYVGGGSGSISGSVVGPSGGAADHAPVARSMTPSAVTTGVVSPAKLPVRSAPSRPASTHMSAISYVMIALLLAGGIFAYRKLPSPR